MTGLHRLGCDAEWKAADGGDPGELEGYASVLGNVDRRSAASAASLGTSGPG
jgi:hypothetical protein